MHKQSCRYKRRHSKVFGCLKNMIRIFKRKPQIINKNRTFEKRAMFISNHSAASGPLTLSLFFPSFFIPWGAHPMTEGYRARWHYLYHIFYRQKLSYGTIKSYLLATLFALVSRMLYRGMRLIPTYKDMRLIKTYRQSAKHINHDQAILVFPEDSDAGYKEHLEVYFPGFVGFSLYFYKRQGLDLPIYPIYFSKAQNAMIIDKPHYVQPLVKKGWNWEEIATYFKDITNDLREELYQTLHVTKSG